MTWFFHFLWWYTLVFLIGLAFLPITSFIFKRLKFDLGYPFAKTLGIITISYLVFLLSTAKIIPFELVDFVFIFLILLNSFFLFKKKPPLPSFSKVLFYEVIFFLSFLFLTYTRGQEPSIRSLEKFMDFGFINSILRTDFFPPKDMWFSPETINYYYFGHLTGAVLIKLTNTPSEVGYNLILGLIFAQGITLSISIVANLINLFSQRLNLSQNQRIFSIILFSLLGGYFVNLGGNLHTIYIFTRGYPSENPKPFWELFSSCNTLFPQNCQNSNFYSYWYPNATRFIPFTIHEFPSYSYVVADLHGHVFDIPFVLLSIVLIFVFFITFEKNKLFLFKISIKSWQKLANQLKAIKSEFKQFFFWIVFFGFMVAIHYMTNAFDGPIYFVIFALGILFKIGLTPIYILALLLLGGFFIIFSLPFSFSFKPFVSGIGVNCGYEILGIKGKFGPFLFEQGNCQVSPLWMLFILWGFFYLALIFFWLTIKSKESSSKFINKNIFFDPVAKNIVYFVFTLFIYGTFLTLIPEFFYIKDIYPAHFRANTMFKLGYQAFIMMSLVSSFTFFILKIYKKKWLLITLVSLSSFIIIYPLFAFPSYYGNFKKPVNLDGAAWLNDVYPANKEIIDWFNKNIKGQPTILEAQGDSYTDFNHISAYTGLPTVSGWWVHQWLWRGSPDFVGKRIPDIMSLYEEKDLKKTKSLLEKYQIKYVIISYLEKQKYPQLTYDKWEKLGDLVFETSNRLGKVYKIK